MLAGPAPARFRSSRALLRSASCVALALAALQPASAQQVGAILTGDGAVLNNDVEIRANGQNSVGVRAVAAQGGTVTTRFDSAGPITIPSVGVGNPYPLGVTVGGLTGDVTKVTVTLTGLTHTQPQDLDIALAGPTGGAAVMLMSDAIGGPDLNNVTLTFDDAAANPLPIGLGGGQPFTPGTFRPTNGGATPDPFPAPGPQTPLGTSLSVFNGQNPNGVWNLFVVDDTSGDSGSLQSFSLNITTQQATPTVTNLTLNNAVGGSIRAEGVSGTTGVLYGGTEGRVNLTVRNAGLIFGERGIAVAAGDTGSVLDLQNSGMITGGIFAGNGPNIFTLNGGGRTSGGIRSGDGADIVTVSGTHFLSGAVGLAGGNDAFTVQLGGSGPSISSNVDGGAGDDTLTFDVAKGQAGSLTLGNGGPEFANFETVSKSGAGTLTLGGAFSPDTVIRIDDGRLVNAATLTSSTADAVFSVAGGMLENGAGGMVSSERTNGSSVLLEAGTVLNRGRINANADGVAGVRVAQLAQRGSITNERSATISVSGAGSTGIDVGPRGTVIGYDVVNAGTISATGVGGVTGVVLTGDGTALNNSGTIQVTGDDASGVRAVAAIPTVTTFTSSEPIAIPDSGPASPYPSSIAVGGLVGNMTKVTVSLNGLSHTFPDDLDILLAGPTGANVLLMADAGRSDDLINVSLLFDDAAVSSLLDNGPIVSGTFRPTNFGAADAFPTPAPTGPFGSALSVFNGLNPNGVWNLFVNDDLVGDSGSLQSFSLNITTQQAVTNLTLNNAAGGTITASGSGSAGVLYGGPEGRVNLTLTNAGVISGGQGIAVAAGDTGSSLLLTNSGTIMGGIVSGSGNDGLSLEGGMVDGRINTGDGADFVTVSGGNLSGSVDLSDGNDLFFVRFGGATPIVNGMVDGGAGSDTLTFDVLNGQSGSLTLGTGGLRFGTFETVRKTGAGALTLQGDRALETGILVEGGTLSNAAQLTTATAPFIVQLAGGSLVNESSGSIATSLAGGTAIQFGTANGTAIHSITNNGSISAVSGAFAIAQTPGTNEALMLTSSGIIDGRIQSGTRSDQVTLNGATGRTTGDIDLGNGDNQFQIAGAHTLTGSLSTGTGNDSLLLSDSAMLNGSVSLGNGINSITIGGSSRLTGNVTVGNGRDTIAVGDDARLTGSLLLDNGNNNLTLGGNAMFSGSVTGGVAGIDSISVSGNAQATASLNLNAGNDIVTVSGSGRLMASQPGGVFDLGDGRDLFRIEFAGALQPMVSGFVQGGADVDMLRLDAVGAGTSASLVVGAEGLTTSGIEHLEKVGAGSLTLLGTGGSLGATIGVIEGSLVNAAMLTASDLASLVRVDGGRFENAVGGRLETSFMGGEAVLVASGGPVINRGQIATSADADNAAAVRIGISPQRVSIVNEATGTITASGLNALGIGVTAAGIGSAYDVSNAGMISVSGMASTGSVLTGDGTMLTNSGAISATGDNAIGVRAIASSVVSTSTFTSSGPITIPQIGQATPYPSSIIVSGLTGDVTKVTASLNSLNHTFAEDVDILLAGPTGANVVLMSDTGGTVFNLINTNLLFDDEAFSSLPDNSQIVSGTFRPTNDDTVTDSFPAPAPMGPFGSALSVFNGLNPNGAWDLFVVDDVDIDGGSLQSFSLNVTTRAAAPAVTNLTLNNAAGGTITANGSGSAGVLYGGPEGRVNLTLTNAGVISGGQGIAVAAGDTGSSLILTNSGTIQGGIVSGSGNDGLSLEGGMVDGRINTGDGADFVTVSGGNLSGSVDLSDGNDLFFVRFGGATPIVNGLVDGGAGSDTLTFDVLNGQSGSLTLGTGGLRFGTFETVRKSGNGSLALDGSFTLGTGVQVDGGLLSNSAQLSTATAPFLVYLASGSLVNQASGTLTATGAGSTGVLFGTPEGRFNLSLTNLGLISGERGIAVVGEQSGSSLSLTNSGTIQGGIASGSGMDVFSFTGGAVNGGVNSGAGDDALTISGGTLSGPVDLSGGNDSFTMRFGGAIPLVNGMVDGGAGVDTLTFDVPDIGQTGTLTLGIGALRFGTFETVRKTGAGTLTLQGGSFSLPVELRVEEGLLVNRAIQLINGGANPLIHVVGGQFENAEGAGLSQLSMGASAIRVERGSLINRGVVFASADRATAIALAPSGSRLSITNQETGSINVFGIDAVGIGLAPGATGGYDINNAGGISATGSGTVGVDLGGTGSTLTNSGDISSFFVGVRYGGQGTDTSTIVNTGLIRSAQAIAVASGDTGSSLSLTSSGTIEGGVSLGDGDDLLTLNGSGSTVGTVSLGGGNDSLTVRDTHLLDGSVLGGAGNDSVSVLNLSRVTGSIDLGDGDDMLTVDIGTVPVDVTRIGRLDAGLAGIAGSVTGGAGTDTLSFFNTADRSDTLNIGTVMNDVLPQFGFESAAFGGEGTLTLTGGAQFSGSFAVNRGMLVNTAQVSGNGGSSFDSSLFSVEPGASLTNDEGATISADANTAVRLASVNASLLNRGTIMAGGMNEEDPFGIAVLVSGGLIGGRTEDGRTSIVNEGRIAGATGIAGSGTVSIVNRGTIDARDAVSLSGGSAEVTNEISGTIRGQLSGLELDGFGSLLTNRGLISVGGESGGSFAVTSEASDFRLINSGTIEINALPSTENAAVKVSSGARIENSGTISATGSGVFGIMAEDVENDLRAFDQASQPVTVVNEAAGTISATGDGAIAIGVDRAETPAALDVSNAGSIVATGNGAIGIDIGREGSVVTNSGSVTVTGDDAIGVRIVAAIPTVTTFTSSGPIAIRDFGPASPYPASITVGGLVGNVTKVTASLNGLNHAFPDDLDILLAGPTGANVLLMSDTGSAGDLINTNLVFDDDATDSLPDFMQIVSGTFRPTNVGAGDVFPTPAPAAPFGSTLSDFNGLNQNGLWNLFVNDDLTGDSGSIQSFSLNVTTLEVSPVVTATRLDNSGTISANGSGSAAILFGGAGGAVNLTLTNTGSISGARGIAVGAGDTGSSLSLTSSGTIEGGVSLGDGDDLLTLNGSGSTVGTVSLGGGNDSLTVRDTHLFDGNVLGGAGNDSVSVLNLARVTGSVDLGDGDDMLTVDIGTVPVDVTRIGRLDAGLAGIAGSVTGGAGTDTLAFFNTADRSDTLNIGTVMNDVLPQFGFESAGFNGEGTLTLTGGALIDNSFRINGGTLINEARLSSEASGPLLRVQGSSTVTRNSATGILESNAIAGVGIQIDSQSAGSTVENAGMINTANGIINLGAERVSISNSGTISSRLTGIRNDGAGGVIVNSGQIRILSVDSVEPGVRISPASAILGIGDRTMIENSGLVRSEGSGVSGVEAVGEGSSIVNRLTGTINAIGEEAAGVVLGGAGSGLMNAGQVSAEGVGAVAVLSTVTDANVTIENSGTISGPMAILGAAGSETVSNTGTISGSVSLGAGNDRFMLLAGQVNGDIDLGDGDDVLSLELGGGGVVTGRVSGGNGQDTLAVNVGSGRSASLDVANLATPDGGQGFETTGKTGAGLLTLTGDGILSTAFTLFEGPLTNAAAIAFDGEGNGLILVGDGPFTNAENAEILSTTVGEAAIRFGGVGSSPSVTINNAGAIGAVGSAIAVSEGDVGTGLILNNTGTIIGNILGGDADDVVTISGPDAAFSGRVDLGGGSNQFLVEVDRSTNLALQGQVVGGASGLTGVRFNVTGESTVATLAIGETGFSALNTTDAVKRGAGALKLTGTGNFGTTFLVAEGTLINAASLSTDRAAAVALGGGSLLNESGAMVSNSGSPTGSAVLVFGGGRIENAAGATIVADGLAVAGISALSLAGSANGAISIVNDGLIEARGQGSAAILTATASPASFVALQSRGTIRGDVRLGSGNDSLTISGLLAGLSETGAGADSFDIGRGGVVQGNIALGSGNDRLVLNDGGDVTGMIDLGDGDDRFQLAGRYLSGNATGGAGTDVLAVTVGAGGMDFDATRFSQFENLVKDGAGALRFTGSGSFGATNVGAGQLVLNGTLGGNVEVAAGAALSGGGTVAGNLLNNGTISPGNSIGTLNVNGAVQLGQTGTLAIELNPSGSDRLAATGAVMLGGTLALDVSGGEMDFRGRTFDIVTGSSVSGAFDRVMGLPGGLRSQSGISGNAFRISFQNRSFLDLASGPNQRSVATVLDAAKPTAGSDLDRTIIGLLNQNSDGLVRTALDSFGLESLSGHRETALAGARRLVSLGLRRGADRRAGECGTDTDSSRAIAAGRCVFLQGFTGRHETEGRAGLAGVKGDIDGLLTGVDISIGDNAALGASLGTSKTVSRNRGGRVEEKSVTAGVHASFGLDAFHVDAAINFAWGELESARQIRLPAAPFSVRAKSDTRSAAFGIEAGYDLDYAGLRFTPFTGLLHVQHDEDGFSEGSAAGVGLRVDGIELKSTRLYGGLSIEPADASAAIQPFVRANVSTETGKRMRVATGRFSVVPEAGGFSTRTVNADRSVFEISGGLRAKIGERISLSADYTGGFGKSTEGQSVRGGLVIEF